MGEGGEDGGERIIPAPVFGKFCIISGGKADIRLLIIAVRFKEAADNEIAVHRLDSIGCFDIYRHSDRENISFAQPGGEPETCAANLIVYRLIKSQTESCAKSGRKNGAPVFEQP